MSADFLFFLDIKLACFANSRIVVFHEVLFTTYAHFDEFTTNWAEHFSIDNNEAMIGILKASKDQQFPSLLWMTYHNVNTTSSTSRF